ncbi:MAG: sugar phosphate isomerase/epimerase family protein [Acidimicrobiales bacterium]
MSTPVDAALKTSPRTSPSTSLGRLAMNQATIPRWSTAEAIEGCTRAGYGAIGLWRDRLEPDGATRAGKLARAAGLAISSLCRGGWFCAPDAAGRRERAADNRRAVDEATELGAAMLVLVCGPAATKDLGAGRREVSDAIAELAEYARPAGVPLAVEPMHPMYCGDRSVVVTLPQALRIARSVVEGGVGVVLDSYHLWWDPDLTASIASAAGNVLGVQLADWLAPPPHPLEGRGMLGDGTIELRRFLELADTTGYTGPVEVEIFNREVWQADPTETLAVVARRYAEHVA